MSSLRKVMTGIAPLSVLLLIATATQAQAPPHWRVVAEAGDASGKAEFVTMPPGWHITTGSAALFFDPRRILEDNFTLTAELFLFPESTEEGYGIFVGGTALDGADARYLALQLRRDGSVAIVERSAGVSTRRVDWKLVPAVGAHPGTGTQRITMSIGVDSGSVSFAVNGAEAARIPRAGIDLAGHFGFRMGGGINVHVIQLAVTEKLAPARAR